MTDAILLLSDLIKRDQFINYDIIERDGKLTKPPVNKNGIPINAHDSNNWQSYDDAIAISERIGFSLTGDDPFFFIDLDHVLIDGKICEWAGNLLTELPTTYTEISPSGDGLHLYYILNDTPKIPKHKKNFDDGTAIEIYFKGRHFTLTENVYVDSPITAQDWSDL